MRKLLKGRKCICRSGTKKRKRMSGLYLFERERAFQLINQLRNPSGRIIVHKLLGILIHDTVKLTKFIDNSGIVDKRVIKRGGPRSIINGNIN